MNIAVITSSISRKAGGLYDAVRLLCLGMKNTPLVFGLKDEFFEADKKGWGSLKVKALKVIGIKSFGYAPNLWRNLKQSKLQVLHLHGIWMYPQLVSLKWKNKFQKPVIISPHGMLDPWAVQNSSWKKKIVGFLFANKSLRTANCLHALCNSEYESIRKFGLKNPVAIIPNGINLLTTERKLKAPWEKTNKKTILFIGRIHPKKGLVILIEAMAKLKEDNNQELKKWQLKIVGWDQGNHQNELLELVNKYNLNSSIEFIGPLFDEDKATALLNADAFILPSYSEGLPMSILEAWAYKLPVIMTKECNIPEGFDTQSAMEIKTDAKDIADKLNTLFSLSEEERKVIGANGYELVKSQFTWKKIASDMESVYVWLVDKKNKPDFVKLN